ncbi:hypothetical protein EDB83DRAFT_2315976 [Lactarius deliciosus]|nr:hypothetical protein EDB83DRAFT_2315976 [Lactarius deliciosus]
MPQEKHTRTTQKKAQPVKAPRGHVDKGLRSQKRHLPDDTDQERSSADEHCKRPKKKQKSKQRGVPVESVNDSNSEDSDEPEIIEALSDEQYSIRDLDEQHQSKIGRQLATKGDMTKDLDLMFSKRVRVNFRKGNKDTLLSGRWCLLCKGDPTVLEAAGIRKCFLTGGNSTLHQHCRRHYDEYKTKCEEADIPVNHHTIPPKIAQADSEKSKASSQTTLDDKLVNHPDTFT